LKNICRYSLSQPDTVFGLKELLALLVQFECWDCQDERLTMTLADFGCRFDIC
jgi:hypothetical protein